MSSEMQMPSSRYVLPSFVEHSAFGAKESNPYNKLFEERIIFLGTQVDDASANDIMAQLLVSRWFLHLVDGDLRHDAVRSPRRPDCLPRTGGLRRSRAAGRWCPR